jgi:hypothetical protein
MGLTLGQIALSLAGSLGGCLSIARRLQFHACAPGLGEADRDGLCGGSRTVSPFSNMMHFLAHEFSSLRAGRFSLSGILTSAFKCFFFRHINLLLAA